VLAELVVVVAPTQGNSPRASAALSSLAPSAVLAGRARADQHVQLVDEDDHPAVGALDLVLDPDETLAERPSQLGARHQCAHVQLQEQAIVAEHPLGQPLDDRRLAHARLTDQDGGCSRAAFEDVEELSVSRSRPTAASSFPSAASAVRLRA